MYFYQRVAQNSFFHSDWGLLVTKAIRCLIQKVNILIFYGLNNKSTNSKI